MAPKLSDEKKSHMVTIRMDRPMKASLDEAAEATGRSLSGEIQHRLTEYESQRDFIDRLLDDSAAINIAVGFVTLRKAVETTDDGIADDEEISLERAIKTAACISELFKVVADHAGQALAEKKATMLAEGWARRIEDGDLKHDFDIQAAAAQISEGLSRIMMKLGKRMVFDIGATIGPHIWGVCFDKDDPLRSPPPVKGRRGLGGNLHATNVGLPLHFMAPLPTKEERKASIDALKDAVKNTPEFRATVKRRINEGQYQGMSEEDAIDAAFNELFPMDLSEAVPDAKAS